MLEINALVIGGFIYLLFRKNTYIAECISHLISVMFLRELFSFLDINFIKYYFVDYLWAFSLNCGLHTIFLPNIKCSFLLTTIVFLIGALYEILQTIDFINGTGDIVDVIMYLLAAITVNLINLFLQKRGETK